MLLIITCMCTYAKTDDEKLDMVLRPYTCDEYFTSEQVRCIVTKFKKPTARVCVYSHSIRRHVLFRL